MLYDEKGAVGVVKTPSAIDDTQSWHLAPDLLHSYAEGCGTYSVGSLFRQVFPGVVITRLEASWSTCRPCS